MSICINDNLIWISIPRCASTSIEHSLQQSKQLNIKYPNNFQNFFFNKGLHVHLQLNMLYNSFGRKETICITRNWFDRWISGLEHMWVEMESDGNIPIIKWEKIDNNWIYKNFTQEYINAIYTIDRNLEKDINFELWEIKEKWNNFFVNPKYIKEQKNRFYPTVLLSENYWKENNKCTYEFDMNEIDKFEKFISNRYDIDFKMLTLNSYKKIPNKINKNDELKNWVWENFEKRFEKRNQLI
jgi:hypothetical protein